MFAVIVVVICLLTAAVIVAVVSVHCRRAGRFVLVPKVGTEYGGTAAVKSTKRVVVMHSNVLYQPGGAAGGKDSESCTLPFLPVVKIETGGASPRLTVQSTAFSEYEIPLDEHWEFPRHL